jgi:PAS domain S-box-containing protein
MTHHASGTFDQLLSLTQDGLIVLDQDGRCRYCNPAAARMLRIAEEALLGASLHELVHPDDPDGAPCDIAACPLLAYRQGTRVEVGGDQFWRADGEPFMVEYTIVPTLDSDRNVTGAVLRFADVSEQHRIEQALQQQQRQRQAFLTTNLDPILTLDQDGLITEFNPAAERAFGYSAPEIIGRPMADVLIPAPWNDWFRQSLKTYRETGKGPFTAQRTQITAIRSSGASFPIEITVTRLQDEPGMVFTCYIRDVTERSWSDRRRNVRYAVTRILAETDTIERAISQSLEAICNGLDWDYAGFWTRRRGANEMALDLVWRRGSIDSSAFEEASRRQVFTTGQGVLGRVWTRRQSSWITDIETSGEYQRTEGALASGFRSTAVMPVIGRHEVIGLIEFLSSIPKRPDQTILRLLDGVGTQLGQFIERRLIEQERLELLASEQRARTEAEAAERRLSFLAEASAQLASSLDFTETLASIPHLAIAYLADYCAIEMLEEDGSIRLLEIAHDDPESEALGRALHETFPTEPESTSPVAEVMRTGKSILIPVMTEQILSRFSDIPEYRAALREMRIDSAMYVPLIARGRTLGAISFAASEPGNRYGQSDLALAEELARRAAIAIDNAILYQEAQNAVRAREEFLSIASHELKTPLTTVKGYTQLLARIVRRPTVDQDRLIRLTDQLEAQIGRFETLISDLLDVSRIQTGRLELRRDVVNLTALARTVLGRFASPAGQKPRHRISLDSPDAISGDLDPDRIDQVLTNLVSNAIKYSPDGGDVTVRIRDVDGTIEIAVSDQGIGIGASDQSRLFQPFSRSETVHRAISGEGLGLYITSQIVERHGGSIFVQSEPDKGSTFTVRLPRDGASMPESENVRAQTGA